MLGLTFQRPYTVYCCTRLCQYKQLNVSAPVTPHGFRGMDQRRCFPQSVSPLSSHRVRQHGPAGEEQRATGLTSQSNSTFFTRIQGERLFSLMD